MVTINIYSVRSAGSKHPDQTSAFHSSDLIISPQPLELHVIHKEVSGLHQLVDLLQQVLLPLPVLLGLAIVCSTFTWQAACEIQQQVSQLWTRMHFNLLNWDIIVPVFFTKGTLSNSSITTSVHLAEQLHFSFHLHFSRNICIWDRSIKGCTYQNILSITFNMTIYLTGKWHRYLKVTLKNQILFISDQAVEDVFNSLHFPLQKHCWSEKCLSFF